MRLPGLPSPWLLVAWLLSLVALGGLGYAKGRIDKGAAQAAQELRDQAAIDAVKSQVGDWLAKYKGKVTTINNEAVHEIRTNTVYADCPVPEQMQELIMRARAPGTSK